MKIIHHQTDKRLSKIINTTLLAIIAILASSQCYATLISELYITEVMANPDVVSDRKGEWFELYNSTSDVFNLNGIVLSDNGSNTHIINTPDPLLINPGEYLVLGKNSNTLENGGYQADYVYSGFTLGNADDEIILTDSAGNILSLIYESGFVTAGASSELLLPDMLIGNYGNSITSYGAGDFGTPGTAGSYSFTVASNTTSVPEPSTLWLAFLGLPLLLGVKKKD